jgi:hypothetical protein
MTLGERRDSPPTEAASAVDTITCSECSRGGVSTLRHASREGYQKGSVVLYLVWPFDKIAVWMLAAPIALSLAAGWAVRAKLWPKGQFS